MKYGSATVTAAATTEMQLVLAPISRSPACRKSICQRHSKAAAAAAAAGRTDGRTANKGVCEEEAEEGGGGEEGASHIW